MSEMRDAILKELQRMRGDDFQLSGEFFANVRSLCQEHAALERRVVQVQADLIERNAQLIARNRELIAARSEFMEQGKRR